MTREIKKLVETLELCKLTTGRDTVRVDAVIEFCKKDLEKDLANYEIEQD